MKACSGCRVVRHLPESDAVPFTTVCSQLSQGFPVSFWCKIPSQQATLWRWKMTMSAISDLQPVIAEAERLRDCALVAAANAADQFRRAEDELTRLEQQMSRLEFLQRLD